MRRVIGLLLLVFNLGVSPLVGTAKEVCGSLQSLDVANGTVTVAILGEEQPKTFSLLKKDVPVTDTLGNVLRLEALQSKHRVALALDEQKEYVVGIRLESDCRWGFFNGLGKDGNEITIRCVGLAQKIPIDRDVRVLIEGKPAQVGDLKIEQPVKLTYSLDHRRVLLIEKDRRTITVNPYARSIQQAGLVLKMDHARRKLEIVDLAERPRVEELEYDVWTPVRLTYSSRALRQTTMDALWPYGRVLFNYDSDLKRISVLSAEVPRLTRRTVTKLDRLNRKLSLTSPDGKTEEFALAPDLKVIRGEQGTASLEELKEGGVVNAALSPDGREVLLLQLWEK